MDLNSLKKRVKKFQGNADASTTQPEQVTLLWGDEPAPGFEGMAAAESLDEQSGEPKRKLRKQDDEEQGGDVGGEERRGTAKDGANAEV